jgi:hypothetical protein
MNDRPILSSERAPKAEYNLNGQNLQMKNMAETHMGLDARMDRQTD